MRNTGKAQRKVRWLHVNKGDENNPEYWSRLVGQEVKQDKREDLFAATPPLEATKLLFSWAVTADSVRSMNREDSMKIDFIDVRRAFSHAPAVSRVCVTTRQDLWDYCSCLYMGSAMQRRTGI